jgi:glucose/mannose transport system permease protein
MSNYNYNIYNRDEYVKEYNAVKRNKTVKRKKVNVAHIIIYILLSAAAVFYLLPVYVLLVTALKNFTEVNLNSMWNLPGSISLMSFVQAWAGNLDKGTMGLGGNFLNSLILVIPATLLSAFVGSINGYIFSKWKFKGSELIFTLFLFGMFIPYQSILIPLVQVCRESGCMVPWQVLF